MRTPTLQPSFTGPEYTKARQKPSTRLLSLDVFRGLTIFFMIVVNNPGDGRFVYWPLEHARWHGLTPTDLVFPFFLFISGVSIVFALSSRKEKGTDKQSLIKKIVQRGLMLILIGIVVHSLPSARDIQTFNFRDFFAHLRYPGVLQRIGTVYIIASLLFLFLETRTLWMLSFGFIFLYYILMRFMPVPFTGHATYDQALNLEAWLDQVLLTPNHMYRETRFWDPEGILSTLPSISTALFGMLTGLALRNKPSSKEKITFLLGMGSALLLGGILFNFEFPVNKNLWSSSFVMVTAGLANLLLCGFYYVIDVKEKTRWTKPLVVYGMNSILVYIIAESFETVTSYIPLKDALGKPISLLGASYMYGIKPLFASPYNASMVWAFCYALAFMPLMWFFYNRKIFMKV